MIEKIPKKFISGMLSNSSERVNFETVQSYFNKTLYWQYTKKMYDFALNMKLK